MLISCASAGRAQSRIRIEQDDPSIVYSGTWYPNSGSFHSGESSLLTNALGAQAIVTFNGTGITWLGVTDPYSGIAWVYLDGTLNTINTYSAATLYQQPLFSVRGLAPGVHTLSIEVPHLRDGNTSGSWVWIDAFDIENGSAITGGTAASAGRVEQTHPALFYSGQWLLNSSPAMSGGSAILATDPGSRATINFNGTGITWIGYRDEYSGIASVYVDGALRATVDTYLTPARTQAPVYTISGLAFGTHTLTIEVTGTHSASSTASWVWVDAFDIIGQSGAAPSVASGGVVSAASYVPAPNNQVSVGQIISIFGSNFLVSGRADATTIPLPTQLGPGNTTVSVCGRNIPLYSVFPGQINAQLPLECPATGTTQLTVTVSGQASAPQTVNLVSASPGIFTVNSGGSGDAVILHANNSVVSTMNPARGGETVQIFCTGLGPTTPSFVTGAAADAPNRTLNPVTVTIGGRNANVAFSGLVVGLVGLYQVNAIVPAGLSGSQPVVIAVGAGNPSRGGVNMAVTP